MPSFSTVLRRIAQVWGSQREQLVAQVRPGASSSGRAPVVRKVGGGGRAARRRPVEPWQPPRKARVCQCRPRQHLVH